jgi:hypothetical protein
LRSTPAADQLHQAYRLDSLQSALHQRDLERAIPLLRGYGVEPVLVKGWAIAKLYPEPGMRPYGDFDLCVLPDQYRQAVAALKDPGVRGINVDLHVGFGKFYDRQPADTFGRSKLVRLGDIDVRVLSDEDHLRFLCMHLLRHGAVRPLWLCDIAVMLEAQADDFDWDRCLSGSRRQADWVACALGLAYELLGAETGNTPVECRAKKLPRWMVPTVLEEWAIPYHMPGQIASYLRQPLKQFRWLLKELPEHWPNPIEATVTVRGPFNDLPRLPFQVGHLFSRAAALIAQLPKTFRHAKS